jgi:hypothetical protein
MKPSVAVVLDKILPGGNLWKWYQSQCTHLDSRGKIQEHELIDNWTSIADIQSYIADFENLVQMMRINDMLEDYPESQNFFDNLPDHVKRSLFIMPGATRVDPKDPTRRKNYAATKDDLVYLITSDWGKHEIESVYDDHIQKLTLTVAGGAATQDTVKHTTKRHIGSVGQFRITITPRSTGQHDTTDHNTKLARITKRLQDLTEADHTLEFKEYTSKMRNQAFLLVHNSNKLMCKLMSPVRILKLIALLRLRLSHQNLKYLTN